MRRKITPEDVIKLLCGPVEGDLPVDGAQRRLVKDQVERRRRLFTQVVEDIMVKKETLERQRQAAV